MLQAYRRYRPSDFYDPHPRGQQQFHRAPHTIRAMFPGNGWGKTTALACEIDAWTQHSNRWQATPRWATISIWFCPEFRQFELIRPQIEGECLTAGWRWQDKHSRYRWPNGGSLYLASSDRDWRFLEGINPDLIAFDEEPPLALWRAMAMRRRGKRKTRYILAATAVHGITWMAKVIYEPWCDYHRARGLHVPPYGEQAAMAMQAHPDIWCWPTGGVQDNPGTDLEDQRWYQQQEWSHENEKQVRLRGGFQSWAGDPVFDVDGVQWMIEEAKRLDGELGAGIVGVPQPVFKGDGRITGRRLVIPRSQRHAVSTGQ